MLQVNIEKIIPVTEARDMFNQIVEAVEGTDELYVLTKNGKPAAVLVGVNHLEKLTGESHTSVTEKIDSSPAAGEAAVELAPALASAEAAEPAFLGSEETANEAPLPVTSDFPGPSDPFAPAPENNAGELPSTELSGAIDTPLPAPASEELNPTMPSTELSGTLDAPEPVASVPAQPANPDSLPTGSFGDTGTPRVGSADPFAESVIDNNPTPADPFADNNQNNNPADNEQPADTSSTDTSQGYSVGPQLPPEQF